MPYTPNQWVDGDKSRPLSAARLTHMETQYDAAMADVPEAIGQALSEDGPVKDQLNATMAQQIDESPVVAGKAEISDVARASVPRRYGRPRFRIFPGAAAWTLVSANGATIDTAYADPSPVGATCTRVMTNGSTAPVMSIQFSAPVDMTGKCVLLWVKIPDMSRTRSATLYVYDSQLSTSHFFTLPVYGSAGTLGNDRLMMHPDSWTPIIVPWNATTTTGTPDRAAVQRFRLTVSDQADGTPTEIRVASQVGIVDAPAAFTNGAVSITIDDSVDLTVAKPKLAQYGIPATLFPIGESLGVGGRPSVADLRTLVDNLGWEVAAHAATSADHVSIEELTQGERLANLSRVRQWHTDNGFPTDVYALPNGTSSDASFDDVRTFFSVVRGVGPNWLESLPPARPEYLRTVVVSVNSTNAATATQVNALIDRAVAANAWLILCFHGIVASGATGQQTNQSEFDAIIDHLASSDAEALTVGDVMRLV